MIVHRLKSFPEKYRGKTHEFEDYCDSMSKNNKAASQLELQAIADICFAVVECYSIEDFFKPKNIILPLRCSQFSKCTGRIRLWIQNDHCVALVDSQS